MPEPDDSPIRVARLAQADLVHDPDDRLALVVEMVRELSSQDDPQTLVSIFRKRAFKLFGGDNSLSLSRRGLDPPDYLITRSTRWKNDVNPWKQKDKLPQLRGGILGELLYGDEPRILKNVCVNRDDPAFDYLESARSLVALPLYDRGVALNMVVRMSSAADAFDGISVADAVLVGNLFGRATSSLVLADQVRKVNAELDRELRGVAAIQRALLPRRLPKSDKLDVAVSYTTATRSGGDYYDFFELDEGRLGVLMADVSGHGTPAAVVMAVLRTMLRTQCLQCTAPGALLRFANAQLCDHLASLDHTFITAFYGIYDPADGSFHYACAGHNPPLLVDRHAKVRELDEAQTLPLGVEPLCEFREGRTTLQSGDTLLLYTDGITEATNAAHEMYGRERLLSCVRADVPNAQHVVDCVVNKLQGFTSSSTPQDDQTLLAIRIR